MGSSARRRKISNKDGLKYPTKVSGHNHKDKSNDEGSTISMVDNPDPWVPGSYIALKALLSARLCSAIWGIITDCDETYNYWEPTHYLLYKKGFQTWEYSPEYALRSYAYLLLHAVPAYFYGTLIQQNRMLVFFFIRCLLALTSACCELYFYRGICKEFGANVARISLGMSIFAAGMFSASTAYLPSSFSMYMLMLSYGAWFHKSYQFAIFTTAISVYLGWPFAAILGVPIALDILFRKHFKLFIKWVLISTFSILLPMIQIDSQYFGRLIIAPVKIVLYNVFTSHGPDLYGTAPSYFYLVNGFLNFNFIFFAALASLPLYGLLTKLSLVPERSMGSLSTYLALSSLYLWLGVFSYQPHKEERFLFPIYPLVHLAAALSIDTIQKLLFSILFTISKKSRHYLHYTNWLSIAVLVLTSTLSLSRIVGQYRAYRAPFEVFLELDRLDRDGGIPTQPINLCYGKEWHRFPSSFFLPDLRWDVNFIKSEFRGQLPAHFSTDSNATSIIPPHMNDLNLEESSRYVPVSSCHFIVDLNREETTELEPNYASTSNWEVIFSVPFLDAPKSPPLLRAFYIPFYTEKYCKYSDYVLMRSKKFVSKRLKT